MALVSRCPRSPHTTTKHNIMLRFTNANSYATRKNAITKLTKFVSDRRGKSLEAYHWIIIAQEDGRFSPMVMLYGDQSIEAIIFAQSGICCTAG